MLLLFVTSSVITMWCFVTTFLAVLLLTCPTFLVLTDAEHSTEEDDVFVLENFERGNIEEMKGDGNIDDKTYGLANGVQTETEQPHDRVRRKAIFTDSGYGSRLSAGSNVAKDYLALQKVFGQQGPGKRAGGDTMYDMIQQPNVIKRDHGYGSRVRAGDNLANLMLARQSLYGSYGPGRKRNDLRYNYLNGQLRPLALKAAGDNGKIKQLVNDAVDILVNTDGLKGHNPVVVDSKDLSGEFFEAPKRRVITDSGYGSRIDAASNVARDIAAIDDVFGIYGPGR